MLAKSHPGSVAVADLVAGSGSAVLPVLYEILARGRASVATVPVTLGQDDQARPRLWNVAAADAASGQPWITNLVHAPVLLNPLLRVLAPLMDGATTRDQLADALEAALRSGVISDADIPRIENGGAANRIASTVDRLIAHCARNALLVP
jgi:hypothetical protein